MNIDLRQSSLDKLPEILRSSDDLLPHDMLLSKLEINNSINVMKFLLVMFVLIEYFMYLLKIKLVIFLGIALDLSSKEVWVPFVIQCIGRYCWA